MNDCELQCENYPKDPKGQNWPPGPKPINPIFKTLSTDLLPATVYSFSSFRLGPSQPARNRQFSWVEITYPGTNNFSQLSYDGLGRNTKIVETAAGSVTSTKQFVWCDHCRCEERDGSGALTKQFFSRGQRNSSTNYFYSMDHLGSIREMSDASAAIQSQQAFDPFGRSTKLLGNQLPDFQFTGYYFHALSGSYLTSFRGYSASLSRWMSRDPLDSNQPTSYQYAYNNPITFTDPLGLRPLDESEMRTLEKIFGPCAVMATEWQIHGMPASLPGNGFSGIPGHIFISDALFSAGNPSNSLFLTSQYVQGVLAHEALHQFQIASGINVMQEGAGLQIEQALGAHIYHFNSSPDAETNLQLFLSSTIEQQGAMLQAHVQSQQGGNFTSILAYIRKNCSCLKRKWVHNKPGRFPK